MHNQQTKKFTFTSVKRCIPLKWLWQNKGEIGSYVVELNNKSINKLEM